MSLPPSWSRLLAPDSRANALLRHVAVGLAFASLVIVAVVAWRSALNSFPDENLHILTASYYLEHWLPPAMGQDLAAYAGAHGVSYFMLWPPQAAYLLFAKASALLTSSEDARWHVYRVFCVLLWAVLLAATLPKVRRAPWTLMLVGLTPQVWYVFTYFSPDAFSYSMAALIVLQLGVPDSAARRYLATGAPLRGGLFLGACFGGLALSKMNYMPFALFSVVYCGALAWRLRGTALLPRRAIVIAATGFAVAGPLLAADVARNGLDREAHFEELRESFAYPGFKPSDIAAGNAYKGLALRQRGVTARAMFSRPWRWGLFTYRSFFGVYGTMDIFSPRGVNGIQRLASLALLGLAFLRRRRPIERDQQVLLGVGVLMILVSLAAAFWRAWTFDFQAQGRYIFAIIPILALLLLDLCEQRDEPAQWGLFVVLGLAGCVSLLSALPAIS